MQAVKDSEPLRTAVDEVQPERVKLSLRLSQSKPLYEAFKGIKEGKLWSQLSEAQQRIVDGELRDFVLGGVALEVNHIWQKQSFAARLQYAHALDTRQSFAGKLYVNGLMLACLQKCKPLHSFLQSALSSAIADVQASWTAKQR